MTPSSNFQLLLVCWSLSTLQVYSFAGVQLLTGVYSQPIQRVTGYHHRRGGPLATRHFARRSSDDDQGKDTAESVGIPQLPAVGASSFSSDIVTTSLTPGSTNKRKTSSAAFVSPKFELQYTCNVCDTRNKHMVSRIAYREGVVIAICKGCKSKHMIADNFGTGLLDGDHKNIEDYFQARGMDETVQRVGKEVFQLDSLWHVDTKGGSLVGDDGNSVLE